MDFQDLLDLARYNELEELQQIYDSCPSLIKDALFQQDEFNGNTLLHMASANGHLDCVRFLRSLVPDDKLNLFVNSKNQGGNTALHWSCMNGHAELTEYLLSLGADADLKNNYDRTSLYYAYESGNEKVKELILKAIKVDDEGADDFIEEEEEIMMDNSNDSEILKVSQINLETQDQN